MINCFDRDRKGIVISNEIKRWPTLFLWCFPHCVDMLVCATCSEYETCHTNFQLPKKIKPSKHLHFCIFLRSLFFFYTRAMNENNLISWAYLQFIINLQNSGILYTSSMIKVILDPKHVAITSKVVPFIHIDPILLVGHNLLKSSIGYLNILRHFPTPLACCKLATLSVNGSHKTLNGLHKMLNSSLETFEAQKSQAFFGVVVCFRVCSK